MKVLVTGAGGYIGSTVVPILLEAGHSVIAVDKFFFGSELLPIHPKLELYNIDVRDIRNFLDFRGVDTVIDLVAISNDPAGEYFEKETYEINHKARANFAQLCKRNGVKRYVFPSSCSMYGSNDNIVDESTPVNPLTTYAKANGLAENDILPLADDNFCVTILRQSTIFGYSPRMRLDLAVNVMTFNAMKDHKIFIDGDGLQWRPFLHVKDTANAMLYILNCMPEVVNGKIFNVGTQNIKIKDLAEKIKSCVLTKLGIDVTIDYRGSADFRNYNVCFDKIKQIGWRPQYTIDNGIEEIIDNIGNIIQTDKTITLNWYKNLEQWNSILNEINNTHNIILKIGE